MIRSLEVGVDQTIGCEQQGEEKEQIGPETAKAGNEAHDPGFSAQFVDIGPALREIIFRYRKRSSLFYIDSSSYKDKEIIACFTGMCQEMGTIAMGNGMWYDIRKK